MSCISYVWRLLTTGLCFIVFGLGGLIVSIFICPFQVLLYSNRDKRKRKARKMVHYLFKGFVCLLKYSGTAKFNIENKSDLEHLSGNIVMANHPSLIDVVVLISIIPNADCVVKATLFNNPFIKAILSNTGYISNDCADGVIEDCRQSLESGNNLIIFPEGTRTIPGEAVRFQRGAANIALRCNAPISPVLLNVEPTTLTKAEKWYHIPNKRFVFSLMLANKTPSFTYTGDNAMSKTSRQFTAVLEQHYREEIARI